MVTSSRPAGRVCVFTIHPADDVRVLRREVASLIKLDLNITLIANSPRDPDEALLRHPQVTFMLAKVPLRPLRKRLFGVLRLGYMAIRTHADAYHFHDPDLFPVALLLRLIKRRHVVYDVHEFYPVVWSAVFPCMLRKHVATFVTFSENALARSIGSVCAVHPLMVERFRQVGCSVALVRNLPSLEVFPPVKVSLSSWMEREIDIVHIGGLTPEKGSGVLVELVERLEEVGASPRTVFVDRFYLESQRRAFLDRLAQSPARHQIELVPNRSVEQLHSLLSRCKFGLSPVLDRGQAAITEHTKVFEYLACGVVPIASDLPGARGILSRRNLGLLTKPGDSRALTEVVLRALNDAHGSAVMAQRGVSAYTDDMNWEHGCLPQLRTLYSGLIHDRDGLV